MPEMLESSLLAVLARDIGQEQFDGMVVFAENAHNTRLCDLASLTLIIHDWFYTLEDEVKYIWGSANTPPKILYLVSRYLGLIIVIPTVADIFPFYCYSRLVFSTITYHLLFYSVEFSMMIRVYALCGQGKRVAFALLFFFMLVEAINVAVLSEGMILLKPLTVPVPESWTTYMSGCVILKFPTAWRYCWLPDLVFNTVMFVISCIRFMPYRSLPDAPLVMRVFRDGAVYYLCMLIYFLIFTVGLLAGDLVPYLEPFVAPVLSVASSHLLLSIRAFVHTARVAEQTSAAVTSLPLDFRMEGSTVAGSYELAACTRTGRSAATNTDHTITAQTAITEVLRDNADVDNGNGHPTLSLNARDRDLEVADPVSEEDGAASAYTLRSRRLNGFSEWIVAE